jgi:hypothetical protein
MGEYAFGLDNVPKFVFLGETIALQILVIHQCSFGVGARFSVCLSITPLPNFIHLGDQLPSNYEDIT